MSKVGMIDFLYEKKKKLKSIDAKRIKYWKKKFGHINKNAVFVIGAPEHANIGDSAIFLAEVMFLKTCGIAEKDIKCIEIKAFLNDIDTIKLFIKKHHLICNIGGGNMGNQYWKEEMVRRKALTYFPDNRIVIFPQTIFFQGKDKERDEKESINYYTDKRNLTLVAREKTSFDIMSSLYSDTNILLTPDIVLSTRSSDYDVKENKRSGVLFCLRSDAEKIIDDSIWIELQNEIKSKNLDVKITDMYSDIPITSETRKEVVKTKMQEFADAELVITDRLHAMIFSAITSTPCIAFGNYNHKVSGMFDWISYLPYVRYVENVKEAELAFDELIKLKDCFFDNEPLIRYFEQIKKIIEEKYRG